MFKDTHVEEGFPRPVSDFGLPPGGVDAAFAWARGDKTYFFKGARYWRYDELRRRMDPGHPAPGPPWAGVPSTLDAAMRWSDGERPGPGGAGRGGVGWGGDRLGWVGRGGAVREQLGVGVGAGGC